jgi:hypothetical protein
MKENSRQHKIENPLNSEKTIKWLSDKNTAEIVKLSHIITASFIRDQNHISWKENRHYE